MIVAGISPLLSGMADYVGNKKTYLKSFCYLGGISVMFLSLFEGLRHLMDRNIVLYARKHWLLGEFGFL
ncbi:MAG: hypothetical protein U5K51_13305 [Flavobacteriaceae bacterium]|nr:hypothetical protein [Flavobacteriaceae bacterium]